MNRAGAILWKDAMDVYRPTIGNVKEVQAVQASQSVVCGKHDTDNYDSPSMIGQSKVNNIMTSDKLHCGLAVDVRAEDVVKITRADGSHAWFNVAGAPKRRPLLAYTKVYLTTSPRPNVVAGWWGS
jgi:hypothetical protein